MASQKALVIDSGRVKRVPDADTLVVGSGIDQAAASTLTIGGTTASSVTLGAAAIHTTVAGNLTVNGTETVVGTTTFQGNTDIGDETTDTLTIVAGIDGDMDFTQGASRDLGMQAAATDTASSAMTITGGAGGAASTGVGGAGGSLSLSAGAGGAGDGSFAGGAGADLTLNAGAGGADGGAGAGADGDLLLGAANTASLEFGNATDNPDHKFLGSGELQFGGSAGTANYVLTSNGAGTNPTWQAVPSATTTLQQAYSNDADGGDVTIQLDGTDGDLVIDVNGQEMRWIDSGAGTGANFDIAADFSANLTHSAGTLLISGGVVRQNDDLEYRVGTDQDFRFSWQNATSDMLFDNTSTIGSTLMRLGTDTGATDFQIQNDSASALLTVDGTGQADFAGNLDANAGLDVSGGALTIDNQAITQTTGGQVTFAGNVDATNGLDVTTAALTAAAGATFSGGEVLVSGGNMQIEDDLVLSMGDGDDVTMTWDNTGSAWYHDNTHTSGGTVFRLGTDTTATSFQVRNNSDAFQFRVQGSGQATFVGNVDATSGLDVTGGLLTAATGITLSGGVFTMTGTNIDLDPTGTFALDMDASQTATITLADNLADALLIQVGSDAYLDITSTDSSEKMEFGNATTNPDYEFLGSGLVDMANGTVDLPEGASISFGGTAGDAALTGANLNTLVDGSNADALHTHANVEASQLVVSSQTTAGFADGDFGYISANNTWTKTDAEAEASSVVAGVNEGTAGTMTLPGAVIEAAKFTTAGGSPSPGAEVYLAEGSDDTSTGAGKLTATAPSTAGSYVAPVGVCLDDANYAGSKTVKILFMPKAIVAL